MPLYEYYCADCQSKFELLVSYAASDADDLVCTKCHGSKVRKLLSVVARPRYGSASDFSASDADYDDDYGGGCSCGGACSCQN